MTVHYQDNFVSLHHGDCVEVLKGLPDASVDAVVTDPPYGISFMGKEWDQPGKFGSSRKNGTPAKAHRKTGDGAGAMDAGRYDLSPSAMQNFQQWVSVWASECLRVLKPGGHMLAFGGSRTWHRLAAGIEDAGFEIRDSIAWIYGSGFPKSLDVSKAIDKMHGHWRGRAGKITSDNAAMGGPNYARTDKGEPATAAAAWEGYGTALKPSFEPVVVARKPLTGTVADNVLEYGTGALNIAGCRVGDDVGGWGGGALSFYGDGKSLGAGEARPTVGRWPSNVLLDDVAAAELDSQSGVLTSGVMRAGTQRATRDGVIYGRLEGDATTADTYGDTGGASRFFPTFRYEAKAPSSERPKSGGVQHPTVKPLALMRWLIRLVSPPGAIVLEPFAGSGTTLEACVAEGVHCIGIEREAKYLPLIIQRISKPITPAMDLWGGDTA